VVLPQGEFAKFLHASSAERKPILQRIFATSGYEVIQQRFAERADEAKQARAEAERSVSDAAAALAGGAGDADVNEVRARIAQREAELSVAREQVRAAVALVTAAERKSNANTTLANATASLEEAQSALAQLGAPPSKMTAADLQGTLQRLRQAQQALQSFTAGERAQAERNNTQKELNREGAALEQEWAALLGRSQLLLREASERERQVMANAERQQAATLAQSLREGAACPVCGSLEHPHPAVPQTGDADVRSQAAFVQRAMTLVESVAAFVPQSNDADLDDATLDDLTAQRDSLIDRADRLQRARKNVEEATAQWQRERETLEREALERDGFPVERDEEVLNESIAAVERELELVEEHARRSQVAERAELAFQTAAAAPELALDAPEVSVASKAHATAQGEVERLDAQLDADREALHRMTTLVDALRAAKQLQADVIQSTSSVIRLADVIAGRGDNQLQQPLSVFVLQAMFDDVLEAANARLGGMLDGRYELLAVEDSPDRRRTNAGLDLVVVDHQQASQVQRVSRTLSGGETFCVSLGLALGLADTVHAYSGGVAIDTLFIDEGFGSLDEATLDDVMAELDRLGQDGRVVGVISHVAAMKAIPERIDVRPGVKGSTISVSWASPPVA